MNATTSAILAGIASLILGAMLDGQPSELQAEQHVADEVTAVAAQEAATARAQHPSSKNPPRKQHPSTVVARAEGGR